ncbi:MAG: TROVE domain-containing protein [Alphaproteobacteria bacterium]|nr:TROVE domain-containing protein [Alphaproteobacteria bacterium]
MGFLNRTRRKTPQAEPHLNWMGGPSFTLNDPLAQLRMAASSCFFGEPMYYHVDAKDNRPVRHVHRAQLTGPQRAHLRSTLTALDPADWRGLSPAALMERAIDKALDADPEATLAEAVRLRSEEHVRTTPQVILVRAARHPSVRGTGLIRRFAGGVIQRADEPAVGLAYHLATFGRPVPNALKRAWRDALERFDDYQLAKYRLTARQVKTVDVVNLVHPRGGTVDRLVRGELTLDGRTWESLVSAQGSSRAAWTEALPRMGHMALLRNLRNLLKAGVPTDAYLDQLEGGVAKGRQLPFRYYSAWSAVHTARSLGDAGERQRVLATLERCLAASVGNLPWFGGRVMSLCDNSGSAQGTATSAMGTMKISTIANLTAILAAQRAEHGRVGVFGDQLSTFAVSRMDSVFRQLQQAEHIARDIGMGTENGIWLFWEKAIRERQHWDTVFVFSDMQAGHGGLFGLAPSSYRDFIWGGSGRHIDVPKLIQRYREQVNPDVDVFLVQVAGYQDTIVPEFYDRTYILGGWGPGLFRFAGAMRR